MALMTVPVIDIASFFSAVLSQNLDPDILVMQPAQN